MDFITSLFAPLTSIAGWGEVVVLMFLEMALGIDNLVFISITSDRLPVDKQHIGRKLGLAAAMIMRCILLSCVVAIMSIDVEIFTLPFGIDGGQTHFHVRNLVFLLGGIYLVYKGIAELRETFQDLAALEPIPDGDVANAHEAAHARPRQRKEIGLVHAVCVIMVMDIVFSLDSVITAAGLSGHIIVMIIAVIGAVTIMIIFADPISNFINKHYEIKTVALLFILLVGLELLLEAFSIEHLFDAPVSSLLYAMMIFGFLTAFLLMIQRHIRERALGLRPANEKTSKDKESLDEHPSTSNSDATSGKHAKKEDDDSSVVFAKKTSKDKTADKK